MTKDITTVLDGIRQSVEKVGRSGRDEVFLDNISFRVLCSELNVPHDADLATAQRDTDDILSRAEIGDIDRGHILMNEREDGPYGNIICWQFMPVDHRVGGVNLDCTVTVGVSDVANDLPQDVLTCEVLLRETADRFGMTPGWLTFNIAYAYVQWDDLEVVSEFEIDMPL